MLALLFLALFEPAWLVAFEAGGPLLVLVDDGWPSAIEWSRRISAAGDAITSASREGRTAAVLLATFGLTIVEDLTIGIIADRFGAIPLPASLVVSFVMSSQINVLLNRNWNRKKYSPGSGKWFLISPRVSLSMCL